MELKRKFRSADPAMWKMLRWSMMAAAIFWVLVYRLGSEAGNLPEFVYVNF
jgi:hypothetical protein